MNIKYLDIEQEDEDDNPNWEDERHMTEKFTAYVLGKISEKMLSEKGETFCIQNVPWTSERKYAHVKTTYRLGCERCTATGHAEDSCPGGKQGTKRDKPSGSEDSEAQRPKEG